VKLKNANQEDAAVRLDFCNHVHTVVVVCRASVVHAHCALDCAAEMQTLRRPAINKQHSHCSVLVQHFSLFLYQHCWVSDRKGIWPGR